MLLFFHKACLPQPLTLSVSTDPSKICHQLPQGAVTDLNNAFVLCSPKEKRQGFIASSLCPTSSNSYIYIHLVIFFLFSFSVLRVFFSMEACSVSGEGVLESRPSLHFFMFFKVFKIISSYTVCQEIHGQRFYSCS